MKYVKNDLFAPVNSNEFVVSVDEATPQIQGTIYHRSLPEGVWFDNAVTFALTIEDVLDCMDKANSSDCRQTSFAGRSHAGRLATFRLDIMFRQHCSWQGKMTWVERGVEMKFRSFLELLLATVDILSNDAAESKTADELAAMCD